MTKSILNDEKNRRSQFLLLCLFLNCAHASVVFICDLDIPYSHFYREQIVEHCLCDFFLICVENAIRSMYCSIILLWRVSRKMCLSRDTCFKDALLVVRAVVSSSPLDYSKPKS